MDWFFCVYFIRVHAPDGGGAPFYRLRVHVPDGGGAPFYRLLFFIRNAANAGEIPIHKLVKNS
jgi:hypothetical protein